MAVARNMNHNDYSETGNPLPLLSQIHWPSRPNSGMYHDLREQNATYHSGSQDAATQNTIPRKALMSASDARPGPTDLLNTNADPGDPNALARSSTRNARSIGVIQEWWLEMLCSLLALAALFAILTTVFPYDGHPLPDWPYGLSINSLISIYIVILKAAMLLVVTQGMTKTVLPTSAKIKCLLLPGISQLKWTWFRQTRPLLELEKYDNASRGILGAANLLWTLRGRSVQVRSRPTVIALC